MLPPLEARCSTLRFRSGQTFYLRNAVEYRLTCTSFTQAKIEYVHGTHGYLSLNSYTIGRIIGNDGLLSPVGNGGNGLAFLSARKAALRKIVCRVL